MVEHDGHEPHDPHAGQRRLVREEGLRPSGSTASGWTRSASVVRWCSVMAGPASPVTTRRGRGRAWCVGAAAPATTAVRPRQVTLPSARPDPGSLGSPGHHTPGREGGRVEERTRTSTPDVVLLACGSAVMFLLVMARMAGLVTSQRLAASSQALAKSRARFEVMIENGSDLVVVTSRDLVVSYVSPTLDHLLGHRPDAWQGRRLDELVIAADRAIPGTMSARGAP